MRVIFITNPCNRAKLLTKVSEFEKNNHQFKQLLIVENDNLDPKTIYMKYFGKDEGKSFSINDGKLSDVNEMNFT